MNLYRCIISIIITFSLFSKVDNIFAQNSDYILNQVEVYFKNKEYQKAKKLLLQQYNKTPNSIAYPIYLGKIYAKTFQNDSSSAWLNKAQKIINTSKLIDKNLEFQYHLWKGYNFDVNKNTDKALLHYLTAKELTNFNTDPIYLELLYQRVLLIYSEYDTTDYVRNWILQYTKIKDSIQDLTFTNNYHNALGKHHHFKKNGLIALDHFNKSAAISRKTSDSNMLYNALFHKGIVFAEHLKQQDSARHYYSIGKSICDCLENDLLNATYAYNMARTYIYDKNFTTAKKWLLKIQKSSIISSRNLHIKNNVANDLYDIYRKENVTDSALYYLEVHQKLSNQLKTEEKEKVINALNTKYQLAEKDKEILQYQLDKVYNTKVKYGLGSIAFILLSGGIILFLNYKNTKRKQRIAEQEKELEIQKTDKILKEQELRTINAMISGQEKERQRLANDLHDNIGSTLVSVKMHIEHLKNNISQVDNKEAVFNKTEQLLNHAYDKVRKISHEKNNGVFANQGLLVAVKQLAKSASQNNFLDIEVLDHGLDQRIDNTMEITLFRIIQELITNVIKHARASEVTISLTNHENMLNIMIEDNGKGFNTKYIPNNEGMGLKSIEKRVEHLEGTMEIDSMPNKGTNVIIDIPI